MALTARYLSSIVYDSDGHTGNTYYARIVNKWTAYIWDNTNTEMVALPSWANSVVDLDETGLTGQFPFYVPAGLPSGNYDVIVYKQLGSAPANTDDIEGLYDLKQGDIFGF